MQVELRYPGKKLFDMFVITDEDEEDVRFEDAVAFLMSHNTSYCAWNCPRMAGLTSAHIEEFFRRMDKRASERDAIVVATVLKDKSDVPPTRSKLEKSGREKWIDWGLVQENL